MGNTEKVMELLESGCNCSQAMLVGFGTAYGLSEELALHLGRTLGGGMGRSALTCGALTGAVLVLGLAGQGRPGQEMDLRQDSFAKVQELLDRFKHLHGGTSCRELLGVDISTAKGFQHFKEAGLFSTRCTALVRDAAGILESLI